MKLLDMADFLDGIASSMDRFLGRGALNDLRAVSDCFRKFPEESVGAFCKFVIEAKEGKPAGRRSAPGIAAAKVEELVDKVKHYLDHRDSYDYAAVRQLVAAIGKLKASEIRLVGERIGCPLPAKAKKADMVSRLENWLTSIKVSADQSSFRLSAGGGS